MKEILTGKVSKDVLAYLYTFFRYTDLSALAQTCKDSQAAFKDITKRYYYIPNTQLRIKVPSKHFASLDEYIIPDINEINSLCPREGNIFCYRTARDALNVIRELYALNPNRKSIPPIFELVIDDSRRLPSNETWRFFEISRMTVPRRLLDAEMFRVERAKLMKFERGILSPLKPINATSDYIELENSIDGVRSSSRCVVM